MIVAGQEFRDSQAAMRLSDTAVGQHLSGCLECGTRSSAWMPRLGIAQIATIARANRGRWSPATLFGSQLYSDYAASCSDDSSDILAPQGDGHWQWFPPGMVCPQDSESGNPASVPSAQAGLDRSTPHDNSGGAARLRLGRPTSTHSGRPTSSNPDRRTSQG